MTTDLSFTTNEKNQSLKDRFEVLIKDTSSFDYLAGYFYTIRDNKEGEMVNKSVHVISTLLYQQEYALSINL